VQDITTLDLTEHFDYIVSWGTAHHLPDPAAGIAILCRALKPGRILRLGVYGYYGNWQRRVQQEIIRLITATLPDDDAARIEAVRTWARGDRNFKNYYTAPPVDLDDDNWVVDEFLHVWEKHLQLRRTTGQRTECSPSPAGGIGSWGRASANRRTSFVSAAVSCRNGVNTAEPRNLPHRH